MSNKLCCIFNTPSLYRENIYSLIDKAYDCYWYFEDTDNKLKTFDTARFKNVTFLKARTFGPFYWVKGMLSTLRNNGCKHYLVMGHSRNLSLMCFLLIKKIFYPPKKTYLWTHGLYGKETRLEYLWKKWLLGLADELLIYGDYACNLMKNAGFEPEKLHPIHNSLSYEHQLSIRNKIRNTGIYVNHFNNNNPTLIFIGRLTIVKRLDFFIEAVKILKEKGENYNVVFVGDGNQRDYLKSIVKGYALEDSVWFYGACYDEETNAELIFNADLCVSPGNVGLTAMHTLMFGCPVLTHDNFSLQMPEFEAIQKGITGDYFNHDNIESLVNAICKWFSAHSADRENIRKNCYKEIDTKWNPDYQMKILNAVIK